NRTNDNFTATHQEGDVSVSVSGTVEGGKAKVGAVEVKAGDKSTKYDGVDKVPEEHRDKAKKLLEAVEKGGSKIEIKPRTPATPVPPQPKKPATTTGRDVIFANPAEGGDAVVPAGATWNMLFRPARGR